MINVDIKDWCIDSHQRVKIFQSKGTNSRTKTFKILKCLVSALISFKDPTEWAACPIQQEIMCRKLPESLCGECDNLSVWHCVMHLSAGQAPRIQLRFIVKSHTAALLLHLTHNLHLCCGAHAHSLFLQKLWAQQHGQLRDSRPTPHQQDMLLIVIVVMWITWIRVVQSIDTTSLKKYNTYI